MALVESANGASLMASAIIDSKGTHWCLVASDNFGLQVAANGLVDTGTANVNLLLYWDKKVLHRNGAGLWWSKTAASDPTWTSVAADPRTPTESRDGATINSATGSLMDSNKIVWTLVSSTSSGLQIARDGKVDATTANVTLLLYFGKQMYQTNADGGWWSWNGSGWADASDPRSVTPTPTPTVTPTSGPLPPPTPLPSGNGIKVDLGASTGTINRAIYGISCGHFGNEKGWDNAYGHLNDNDFRNVLKSLNIQAVRLNWDADLDMTRIFYSGSSRRSSPDFSHLNNFINSTPSWFPGNETVNQEVGRFIITIGCPHFLNPDNGSDMATYTTMARQVAQYFKDKGFPCFYWETYNEPGYYIPAEKTIPIYKALRAGVKQVDSRYVVGGIPGAWWSEAIDTWVGQTHPDFFAAHEYTSANTGDSDQALLSRIANQSYDGSDIRQKLVQIDGSSWNGTAKPIFISEYNINGGPGAESRTGNWVGGMYTALRTQVWALSNAVQGAHRWDIYGDSMYGVIDQNQQGGSHFIRPAGYVLQKLGSTMPGTRRATNVQGNLSNLKVLASSKPTGFGIQLTNYGTSAYNDLNLVIDGLPTTRASVNQWILNGSNQNGTNLSPIARPSNNVMKVNVPAMSVVVLS